METETPSTTPSPNTTIQKLTKYFREQRKFNDYACFVITREIQNVIGFTEGESDQGKFWERFMSAVQDVYPDTDRVCHHFTFGSGTGNLSDEDKFSAFVEHEKEQAEKNSKGRIICLFHINKFKDERFALDAALATHRADRLHFFIFEESFPEGKIPFVLTKNCDNASHLARLLTAEAEAEGKALESRTVIPENELESAIENAEVVEETATPETEEIAETQVEPEAPLQPGDSQAVTNPIPNVPPNVPNVPPNVPPTRKTFTTKNYIRDAYAGNPGAGNPGFSVGKEKVAVFKFYDKDEVPAGAIFVATKIERDGVVDLGVPNYDYLKPNEKLVHLYRLPDKK
jgi:hypothetical protein